MSEPDPGKFERADVRAQVSRDLERRRRREPASRFWQAVALVGSVGWPIVLLATAGALAGRWADHHWDTGVRITLTLLSVGTAAGTWMAFRAVRGGA